ncbi:MAG: T9SS type A sorting domain-containing protein [Flavobacteriales bacterium]|nr:T9SS type A sorting domain-containing protein [Flavobacteriales bacterium]
MIELPNGNTLVSGVWADELPPPFKRTPFIMQFTPELDLISNFEFGNAEVDNWYPWMNLREDGNVMFAYAHGVQWDEEINTYAIWDMRLGLYDPIEMDTVFVKTYPHQGIIQRLQDFEPTSDGGYIILAQGVTQDAEGNGEVPLFLLKVNSEFEEEWFQTYEAPQYSWDIIAHDLEVTSDGGYAILSQFLDMENTELTYYKTWLLKLDACGDMVWNGCPFVGVEENKGLDVQVYPNPFTNHLHLTLPEVSHLIEVYNSMGALMNIYIAQQEMDIDLSQNPKGTYLVRILDRNNSVLWSEKVVRE